MTLWAFAAIITLASGFFAFEVQAAQSKSEKNFDELTRVEELIREEVAKNTELHSDALHLIAEVSIHTARVEERVAALEGRVAALERRVASLEREYNRVPDPIYGYVDDLP